MADVNQKVGIGSNLGRLPILPGGERDRLVPNSRRRRYKIGHGLAHVCAFISVGDQNCIGIVVLEDAAFENERPSTAAARQKMPFAAGLEVRLHAERSAPIQIVGWIAAISEPRGYRNDSLTLVVRQGNKYVNDSRTRLRVGRLNTEGQGKEKWGYGER